MISGSGMVRTLIGVDEYNGSKKQEIYFVPDILYVTLEEVNHSVPSNLRRWAAGGVGKQDEEEEE